MALSDWTELGSVPGPYGPIRAFLNPAAGVTLIDGASNSVVIPRGSLAALAELLQRAAMPGQEARDA